MEPFWLRMSCAVGHPDCIDTVSTDNTIPFIGIVVVIAVLIVVAIVVFGRRERR